MKSVLHVSVLDMRLFFSHIECCLSRCPFMLSAVYSCSSLPPLLLIA